MANWWKGVLVGVAIGVAGSVIAGCDGTDNKEMAADSGAQVDVSEALPAAKVKALLVGNTLEIVQEGEDKSIRRYYSKDGTFVPPGRTGGRKGKMGRWRVNDQGQECIQFSRDKEERCLSIVGDERGGYARVTAGGKVVSRITAVIPGNPGKL